MFVFQLIGFCGQQTTYCIGNVCTNMQTWMCVIKSPTIKIQVWIQKTCSYIQYASRSVWNHKHDLKL